MESCLFCTSFPPACRQAGKSGNPDVVPVNTGNYDTVALEFVFPTFVRTGKCGMTDLFPNSSGS